MIPDRILDILDLALEARKRGYTFNPLFIGEAGLGKSEMVYRWVEKQRRERNPDFGIVELRIAYMEPPDLIGLPDIEVSSTTGMSYTTHRIPDFWPRDQSSEGLLFLEEPNRGTTGIMNGLMQLLTERRIHRYTLPPGWIIAASMNPDSRNYTVNTMDAALRDRFQEFTVHYSPDSFLRYMRENSWHPNIVSFISRGLWKYEPPENIFQSTGAKYISPRTWSRMNSAEMSGLSRDKRLHELVSISVLGRNIGTEYHKYCYSSIRPVLAPDILEDKEAAMERLRSQSMPDAYRGDMLSLTVQSILDYYSSSCSEAAADTCRSEGRYIDEATMLEVAKVLPVDLAVSMIKACGSRYYSHDIVGFFTRIAEKHPDLAQSIAESLEQQQQDSSSSSSGGSSKDDSNT